MVTSRRAPAFFPAFPAVMASAAVLAFAATLTPAQAQSALAGVESQIQRYGCNLPQYANSVPACRELHARARALRSGSGSYVSGRAPYGATSTPRQARPAQSSGGGFFSSLFGGGSSNSYSGRSRYDTYNSGRSSYGSGESWGESYSPYAGSYGRYRTLCVRTCDGYYFPISFSASRSGLARDAKRCEASCGAPAKLFYHRNPGADVEHMVSLDGERYAMMENAFRYREEYVQDCRCKPEPWSEAAKEMYQQRVEAAANPDAVKPAENQTAEQTMTQTPSAASDWRTRNYARPAPRRRVQKVDPAYEGRWWAGSW